MAKPDTHAKHHRKSKAFPSVRAPPSSENNIFFLQRGTRKALDVRASWIFVSFICTFFSVFLAIISGTSAWISADFRVEPFTEIRLVKERKILPRGVLQSTREVCLGQSHPDPKGKDGKGASVGREEQRNARKGRVETGSI